MEGLEISPPDRMESMRHSIRINLKGRDPTSPIVECRTHPLSTWLWRLLFGKRHSVVVLMPGGSVDSVNITEQPEAVRT